MEKEIIQLYYDNGKSGTATVRAYQRKYKVRRAPFDECKVRRVIIKFEQDSFVNVRKSGSGRPSCSGDIIDAVVNTACALQDLHPYNMTSVRNVAAVSDIGKSTVHKILSHNGYKPYRPTEVHQLLPGEDDAARLTFATRALDSLQFSNVL